MASSNSEAGQRRQGKQQAPAARHRDGSTPKPKRKPRDRSHPHERAATPTDNVPYPSTPPKTTKSHQNSTPTMENQNPRSQTKTRKKSPAPPSDVHPPQSVTAATPVKPVQIYAGPTFHASPAPSSLPIPKMFSKSVPQVNDKDASLRSMLHSDVSEESEVEGSPTLRSAPRAHESAAREESPLDIFFQKDREEKARRQLGSPQSSFITPPNTRRSQSTSPGPGSSGAGGLRPPETSVFPLDMDGNPSTRTPPSRLEDSPSVNASVQDVRSAEARAKTEALKSLLRFHGTNQRSVSESNSLASSRSSSRPPKPPPTFERSTSERVLGTESFPIRPSTNPANGPSRHITRHASQLRQQLDQVAHEHYASGSSSPRARIVDEPIQYPPHPTTPASTPNGPYRASPGPAFSAEDAIKATLGNRSASSSQGGPNTAAMEEQLRRILKLDSLSSAGVQS